MSVRFTCSQCKQQLKLEHKICPNPMCKKVLNTTSTTKDDISGDYKPKTYESIDELKKNIDRNGLNSSGDL